jgi:hypothetical protein
MIQHMAPELKAATFRLERDILTALQAIKARDGIPVSEQVRRALLVWIDSKAIEAPKRRVSARRKG